MTDRIQTLSEEFKATFWTLQNEIHRLLTAKVMPEGVTELDRAQLRVLQMRLDEIGNKVRGLPPHSKMKGGRFQAAPWADLYDGETK